MENEIGLGKTLSDARKNLSWDIRELAQKTKINPKILESLESNKIENLPKFIYVKGFIKILAKNLKIDEAQLLEELNQLYNPSKIISANDKNEEVKKSEVLVETKKAQDSNHEILERIEFQERIDSFKKIFLNKKSLIIAVATIAIIFIINLLSMFISNLKKEQITIKKTFETQENPEENKDTTASASIDTENIKSQEEPLFESKTLEKMKNDTISLPVPVSKIDSEETPVTQPEKKTPEPPVTISEGKKFPFKKFYPAPRNVFNVEKNSNEAKNITYLPEFYKNKFNSDLENVLLYAQEDIWISYSVDNGEIKRYVLSSGKHLFIQGKLILLFLGNFNSAKIFYNNQLVSAQTTTGVKSLIFPEAASQEMELPLFPSFKGIPYSQSYYKDNMSEEAN